MRIAPAMLAIFASVFVTGIRRDCPAGCSCERSLHRVDLANPAAADDRGVSGRRGLRRARRLQALCAQRGFKRVERDESALRRAGAVAVKQYAWFHVLKWRGGKYNGDCFDVKDTTADQLYKAKAVRCHSRSCEKGGQLDLVVAPDARRQVHHDRLPHRTECRVRVGRRVQAEGQVRAEVRAERAGRRPDPAGLLHGSANDVASAAGRSGPGRTK